MREPRLKVIGLAGLALLFACVEGRVPATVYSGSFDTAQIGAIEEIANGTAEKWNLRPFRKDREQMRLHNSGKDAFFVALYLGEDPLLVLTNAGFGSVLTLAVNHYPGMAPQELQRLSSEVRDRLSKQLGIELKEDASAASRH